MYDVITIGGATVDIYAMSDSLQIKDGIFGVPISSKSEISSGFITCGGGATNAAVTFKKLGLKTSCLTLIGNDYFHHFIKNSLKKEGVDRRLMIKDPKSTTDYSIILVSQDGRRSVLVNRGKYDLEEKHIPWKKIVNTKWFYISSLSGNINLLEKIVGFAKENKIKIALNPGGRELAKRDQLIHLLRHVDFLSLNKEEAEMLCKKTFENKSFWPTITSYKPKIIAITNGRDGAYIHYNEQIFYSPIIKVKTVDETGAGDAFGSAFTAGIIHGIAPKDSLVWGIRNAASVVSYLGAKNKILTLKEIRN